MYFPTLTEWMRTPYEHLNCEEEGFDKIHHASEILKIL